MSTTTATRLAGKRAIITGGTTGLGFASARAFLEQGAQVLITGRSQPNVDAALQELNGEIAALAADSTSLADLEKLADTAASKLGSVDILFVNAGVGMFGPIEAISEELYDDQFNLNVKGALFTVQKILPLMKNGGSIIFTGSAVHSKGAPGGSLLFASKAAVRSLVRCLAAELGPRGIRVNSLSPGIVPTQFFANSNAPDELYNDFEAIAGKAAPLGRAGKPEEIANVAVFLASDESTFVTAADYVVDGGWSGV